MMKSILAVTFGLFAVSTFSTPAADRDHPKELAVLERFLGTWDHEVSFKHVGKDSGSVQKIESKRTWSAGGAFLRIEDVNWAMPQYDEFHMLLTFDALEKIYTGVIVDGVNVSKVTANWDEASATMAFNAKGENGQLKYTLRFIDENNAEGKGTFSKPDGKPVANITWKQTRRAE